MPEPATTRSIGATTAGRCSMATVRPRLSSAPWARRGQVEGIQARDFLLRLGLLVLHVFEGFKPHPLPPGRSSVGHGLATSRRPGLTRRMDYRLDIGDEALAQLRALPREQRRRIGQRLDVLQHGLQGDVKKLAGQAGKYRLRVGDYRVLFTLEKDLIFVHQVKDRKDAYRD